MNPILIIDNNFIDNIEFYNSIKSKYELHLAGCTNSETILESIDTSRIFLKNSRSQIEFVEQDFINACMLFIQIYVPEFIYFRNTNELVTPNSIEKIVNHSKLLNVDVLVHENLKQEFEKYNFKFVIDEAI